MVRQKRNHHGVPLSVLKEEEEEDGIKRIDHQRLLDLLSTTGKNLSGGLDFRSKDLSWVDFSSAKLCGARFGGANLTGADFTDANLRGAIFDGATLTGAMFLGANLKGAALHRVDRKEAIGLLEAFKGDDAYGAENTPQEARRAGLTAAEMMAAGYTCAEAKAAGYSQKECKLAGYPDY